MFQFRGNLKRHFSTNYFIIEETAFLKRKNHIQNLYHKQTRIVHKIRTKKQDCHLSSVQQTKPGQKMADNQPETFIIYLPPPDNLS